MQQYVDLLTKILEEGEERGDRTGTGTLSVFGGQLSFDLRDRFPLVSIKKTLYKSAFTEMLWFIRGEPNTRFLKQHNIPIWDAWADKDGNLGPVYGVQWRSWPGKIKTVSTKALGAGSGISFPNKHADYVGLRQDNGEEHVVYQEKVDQLRDLIARIKSKPEDRRLIVTAWNPGFVDVMGLPPCHRDFQCYVSNDGHLDLMMAIRSWDTCLGGPFNIAQYALLTHLIARATGLKPRHLKINYGDAHIYLNHVEAIRQRLNEVSPLDCKPKLVFNTDNIDIDGYKPEDFDVTGYESHPFLKLPIAV
jgi:thymidylate synthase